MAGEPVECATDLRVRRQLRKACCAVGKMSNGANRHGQKNNRKQQAFQAPIIGEFQCGATPVESARSSSSVRTRADFFAASSNLVTSASSAEMPRRSSQKSTLDLPLIGPISITWSSPNRCDGTPL